MKRKAEDFSEEIRAHIEIETERLRGEGLSEEEARTAAHREFGNVGQAQERFYESRRWMWLDHVRQDIRYAARLLRKSPAFTITAALTIALGIGATTAIFSVVDATLLHPLPYPHPEQLVRIQYDMQGTGSSDVGFSEPEWQDLEHSGIFQHVSPDWYDDNNLNGSAIPLRVSLSTVAPNYFALLGVNAELGRTFDVNNHGPGYTLEVVISDGLWKRAFGGDPHILERSIRMDTDLYRVVGVMPPGFHSPGRTSKERNIEVWAACNFYGAPLSDHPPRNLRNIPTAIGRIQPGLTLEEAQTRLDALVATLQKQYPNDYPAQSGWKIRLLPLQETVVGNVRQSLLLIMGAVGLVLLIGCVNVANLLLARSSARAREIAVRQALGAGRGRLIVQLLTESLLLFAAGGVAGVVILLVTKRYLLRMVPESLPRLTEVSINWTVLLFAIGVSLAAGLLFGLAPALHAREADLVTALKEAVRGSSASGGQARTRRWLVATEFAVSLVLMIAAGLLLRSFWDLVNVPMGFNPGRVMVVRTRMPYPNVAVNDKYPTFKEQAPFFRELLRRAKTLAGVAQAAIGNFSAVPLDHPERDQTLLKFVFDGRQKQSEPSLVSSVIVTPEYFDVLGMRLARGRLFGEQDDEKAPQIAVVNETMAREYWPHENPIGKHFKESGSRPHPWITVVGVVEDARSESLEDAPVPQVYLSLYQEGAKHVSIFLRGQFDTAAMAEAVRAQVQSLDDTLPVFGAETLTESVTASLAQRRFSMQMVGLFAVTALLLAAVGIYGVISYMVNERTREVGIRLALGAHRMDILTMVLRQGLTLALTGAGAGIVGGLIVSQLMAGVLFGVRPTDPVTFAGVAALLIGVATAACLGPARRAVRVDPMVALRYE